MRDPTLSDVLAEAMNMFRGRLTTSVTTHPYFSPSIWKLIDSPEASGLLSVPVGVPGYAEGRSPTMTRSSLVPFFMAFSEIVMLSRTVI